MEDGEPAAAEQADARRPHRVVAAAPRCSPTHPLRGIVKAPRRAAPCCAHRVLRAHREARPADHRRLRRRGAEPRLVTDRSTRPRSSPEAANYINRTTPGSNSTSCAPRCATSCSTCTRHLGPDAGGDHHGKRGAARARRRRGDLRGAQPARGRLALQRHAALAAAVRHVRVQDAASRAARAERARRRREDLHRRRVHARAARRMLDRDRALRDRRPVVGTVGVIGPRAWPTSA